MASISDHYTFSFYILTYFNCKYVYFIFKSFIFPLRRLCTKLQLASSTRHLYRNFKRFQGSRNSRILGWYKRTQLNINGHNQYKRTQFNLLYLVCKSMNMKVHQTLVLLKLLSFRTKDLTEPTIGMQSGLCPRLYSGVKQRSLKFLFCH